MGSKKTFERTKEIESIVPEEIRCLMSKIRMGLNGLEDKLATDFSNVNDAIVIPHLVLQEALYIYCQRLSEAVGIERMKRQGIIHASVTNYTNLVPEFIEYLRQFGEVFFGLQAADYEFERAGVFLRRRDSQDDEPKLLGFLDVRPCLEHPKEIEYSGYVPKTISDLEFFKVPIYHLSDINLGLGNVAYVRLFCEMNDGKASRLDSYEDRGIYFP